MRHALKTAPAATETVVASAAIKPSRANGKQTARRIHRASEILTAAREIFLKKGFERASVGEIATKVGVVESLVYAYFPSKRDLLNEVLRGMYEPLIRDIDAGFSRLQGLRSRLRFLVWRHLRVYIEEPQLTRLVLHEVRTGPEYFSSMLHDLQVRYIEFLMLTLREAIASGELPRDTDVEMVRSMVYGGIEHRMWATLFGRGTINVEAMADRYTAMVLSAITTPGATASDDDIERRLTRLERIVASAPPARQRKQKP